ncbi:hypothetical protein M8C21_026958 [Ambrosia artemisiifolia]|uniref:Uncharacterized protein n=1 Tax=Ambrosia artemisiifolia TaxID=4212 RepID=A0AAD5CL63_AMBAR|nr:hypothetical protein M8C21_026958 [Ambrosia artemisiifolia]
MEAPQVEAMSTETTNNPPQDDTQDNIIDTCCSCIYECTETVLDYLFCGLC